MGNALKDQGKLGEAIEAYENGLSLNPSFTDVIEYLMGLKTQLHGTMLAVGDKNKHSNIVNLN